jgi:hemolysin III
VSTYALHLQPKPRLRGWSHVAACLAAVALCPILIVFSPGARVPASLYGAATIGLFGVSATYHRFRWRERAHSVLRRIDHSMIFVAIAATYTPVALALPDGPGALILSLVWTGAAAGVATQLFWPTVPRGVVVSLYVVVGWAALLVIDDVWRSLGVTGFVLLITGGILHTAGAAVYARQRPNPFPTWFGFHEIFHLFVVAAVATHYVAVGFFALPSAAAV